MLSNAYFLAKFRFDTAENEPAKNLQNFSKNAFSKNAFSKNAFLKNAFNYHGSNYPPDSAEPNRCPPFDKERNHMIDHLPKPQVESSD